MIKSFTISTDMLQFSVAIRKRNVCDYIFQFMISGNGKKLTGNNGLIKSNDTLISASLELLL